MTRTRLAITAVGSLVLALAAWALAERFYLAPARSLIVEIESAEKMRRDAESLMSGRAAWAARRDALGSTMIAGPSDEFEHTLRAGLAAVADHAGLGSVSSGNGRPVAMASPAARRAGRRLGPILRSAPDFHVVHAWLAGEGDLESVLTTIATLRAQPWVHRIEGFTIKPANRKRTRFELRVDLASLRMDTIPRGIDGLPALAMPNEATLADLAAVLHANPFGAELAVAEEPSPPPSDPLPGYAEWRVTGLIEGVRVEALMLNQRSGERRVVVPGGRVLNATFETGSGERAIFIIDGETHAVRVGDTLDDRRPAPEHADQAAQARAEEATP